MFTYVQEQKKLHYYGSSIIFGICRKQFNEENLWFILLTLSSFYLKYLFLVKFLIPRYSNANLNLQQLINKSKAALLLGLLCLLRCILFNRRY